MDSINEDDVTLPGALVEDVIDIFDNEYTDSEDDEDDVTLANLHPDIIRVIIPLAEHPVENLRLVSVCFWCF